MTERFAYRGMWFLPEKPDDHVVGTLHYELNQYPYLDLTGTLVERTNEFHEPDFILGFTTDGKRITLYRSYESQRSTSMPGIQVSQYKPLYILKAAHFSSEDTFTFKMIKGRFRNLEPWVDVSGFEQADTNDDTNETILRYKLPQPINFALPDRTIGSLNFTYTAPFGRPNLKAEIKQHTEIHLELAEPKSLIEAVGCLMVFQNFLTLATFEVANPFSITVTTGALDAEDFARVEVFYKPGYLVLQQENSHRHNFLFTYKDIETDFQKIISLWVGLTDTIEPVLDLLLDSFYREEV